MAKTPQFYSTMSLLSFILFLYVFDKGCALEYIVYTNFNVVEWKN